MDKDQVIAAIVGVLSHIQSISGRDPVAIDGSTCPIGDLCDFDSLNGVEATVELSDRLRFDLPGVNAFVNEEGTMALQVSDIANNICNAVSKKEAV